jgi:hypothetical protein
MKSEKSISGLMMGGKLKFSRRSNSKKNQRKDEAAAKVEVARENTEALKVQGGKEGRKWEGSGKGRKVIE